MLARKWKNRNTPPFLVGLQTGTTTLEINLEVPQETGNRSTWRPSYITFGVQWSAQLGIQLKGKLQGLTLLLMLWCAHKKGSTMTAFWKTQQVDERANCRHLQPKNQQKLLCGWIRAKVEGRPAVSTNQSLWNLSDTGPPTRQHTPADMRPPIHIQQRNARSGFSQRRCN